MRNLFKSFPVCLIMLILCSAGYASAQKTDTQKVAKTTVTTTVVEKKKPHRSYRDSVRQQILKRNSMIRSFKQSDAALNDLLGKIEDYTSKYIENKNDLDRGFDTLDISQRLPSLEHRLGVMRTTIDNSSTMGYLVTIRDMIDHLQEQTNEWQDQLNKNSDALDTIRQDISDFKADTALKVVPADSALMVKCINQISELKLKWGKLDTVTQKAMIRIGRLENRVSSLLLLLIDLDNKIDLKIHDFTVQAMDNEYGYLWDMNSHNSSARLDTAISRSYRLNSKFYKYFFISKTNYWGHVLSLLLVPLFFIWIYVSRRKLKREKENYDEVFNQTHYVVKHPYWTALAITSLLAPYFYDHPAQIFTQTMLLVSMIAMGALIKSAWPKPLHVLWLLLLTLSTVFSISNLMVLVTNADRFLMLLLSLIAIYGAYRFIASVKNSTETYPPFIGIGVRIFISLHVAAVVLNTFGRFSLAKIIATTATFNLCLAIGFYLVVQILMESLFLQLEANKRIDSETVSSYLDFKILQKKFKDILVKIMVALWIIALAKNLTIDDYLYDTLKDFLTQKYRVGSTAYTFGNVLTFFVVIWLSGLLARVISYFYDFRAQQTKLTPEAKKTRSSILLIRLTVFIIGFFVAITAADIPMTQVTIVIGALGVGIGFGLQNIVNNLVSGIILAFEKPIQVGDIIEVSGKSGTITEIGIRASKIACGDGSELIVPNGDLISQHVVNWTLSDNNRQVELIVGVAYGTDITKAESLLKEILNGREDIMKSPPPSVLLHNFSDSAVDFKLLFWAADIGTWARLRSEVMSDIYTKFTSEGIEIPHPKRDIQVYFPKGTILDDIAKLQHTTKNPPAKDR